MPRRISVAIGIMVRFEIDLIAARSSKSTYRFIFFRFGSMRRKPQYSTQQISAIVLTTQVVNDKGTFEKIQLQSFVHQHTHEYAYGIQFRREVMAQFGCRLLLRRALVVMRQMKERSMTNCEMQNYRLAAFNLHASSAIECPAIGL